MRDVWKVLSKVVGTWKMLSDNNLTSYGLSERQHPHSPLPPNTAQPQGSTFLKGQGHSQTSLLCIYVCSLTELSCKEV